MVKELPEGWEVDLPESVQDKIEKVNPTKSDSLFTFKYVDISSIYNLKIANPNLISSTNAPSRTRQLVKTSDILFSTVRYYLKRIALVQKELNEQIASTGFCVIRVNKEHNFKFIYYQNISNLFIDNVVDLQRGVSYPAVRNKNIFCQNIVRLPLSKQKRIVAKLDGLFAHIDQVKRRLARVPVMIADFRMSVLTKAVTGELTKEWRKGKDLGEWEEKSLGEVCEKSKYGTSKKSLLKGDIPVLRMGNLQSRELDWTKLKYSSDIEEIEKCNLKKDDLLFNRTNSPELVGKTSI